jgi:anti-sigma factor RsiW
MTCDGVEPLVDAYVDGELDFEKALAVEAHAVGCAACAARLEGTRTLARTMKTAPYFRAPAALAQRVRATTSAASATGRPRRPDATRRRQNRWWPWLIAVASAAVVVLAVGGLLSRRAAPDEVTMQAVIDGHVRSLMAEHLTDVISSDRHTVKPWFAGRIRLLPDRRRPRERGISAHRGPPRLHRPSRGSRPDLQAPRACHQRLRLAGQ